MSEITEGLNDKQIEAVKYLKGPMLVVAGAGSGKTKALTHRIAYMIKELGISPWNILAVTFTNKAANEMKERVTKLLQNTEEISVLEGFADILSLAEIDKLESSNYDLPTIGTFHSICVRILRKNIHLLDYENTFAIYDTTDQKVLMKRIMNSMAIDPKRVNYKAVLTHVSNAKNQLIGPQKYREFSSDYFSQKVGEIYPKYQKALQKANALDFDDIIMKTVELFQQFPEVLEAYQDKFKYISVDEYQDTNHAQYVLIKLLAEKYKNICVIGDADQSIYGWRGATIQNMLDFEKDYPDAKTVMMEQNYRSSAIILEASNKMIAKNTKRKEKNLWTEKKGGEKIKHWISDNERHEAELITQEINKLLQGSEHINYKQFVVLYRTNAQSRVIEEIFLRNGIPYKLVGGIKFYERKEIKDILAYLRVIQNPNDIVSLMRIINTPSRKIGAKTLETVQEFSIKTGLSFWNAMLSAKDIENLSASKAKLIENFVKIIQELQDANSKNSASGIIKEVIENTGYKRMVDDGSIEGESRMENIQELVTVAKKYDCLEAGMSLNIFLEEVSLIADIDTMKTHDNAVTLMTVHSAKGLEFPYVFIAGLEEGIFPHNRSLFDMQQLEEERRLLYVAMTRAMEALYLLHARSRTLYGESKSNAASQFLAELDEELVQSNIGTPIAREKFDMNQVANKPIPLELEKGIAPELVMGDRIRHNIFGKGIVVGILGGVVTIAFDDSKVGVKKLALSIAPIQKI